MRLAVLSHGRDGFQLNVDRVPFWAWAVGEVAETITMGWLCPRTGHAVCSPPDWMFRIGFGRDRFPSSDSDGQVWHRWSLGSGAFWLSQHAGVEVAWKRTTTELKIPLTNQQAARINATWVADILESLEDDDDPDVSDDAARWRPERAGQ